MFGRIVGAIVDITYMILLRSNNVLAFYPMFGAVSPGTPCLSRFSTYMERIRVRVKKQLQATSARWSS